MINKESTREEVLDIVIKNGLKLKHASKELQNDKRDYSGLCPSPFGSHFVR